MTRKPSCLISCSHSLPEGSLSVLVGRHGAMNPAGRVRCNIAPIAKGYTRASQAFFKGDTKSFFVISITSRAHPSLYGPLLETREVSNGQTGSRYQAVLRLGKGPLFRHRIQCFWSLVFEHRTRRG